jgi:hypothetical protein
MRFYCYRQCVLLFDGDVPDDDDGDDDDDDDDSSNDTLIALLSVPPCDSKLIVDC